MERTVIRIPEPTLKRLPLYHHYLKSLLEKGRESVSCTHIGEDLNLDPPQIRKDLAYTGIKGMPKVGYNIPTLLNCIETFFGWNRTDEAFLAGTGNLGRALLGYEGFARYGFKIIAAFDNCEKIIGKTISGIKVLPIEKMPGLIGRMKVKIAVLATPEASAQSVADALVQGGIKAIWNFAPVTLKVPENIIVQNENLASGLAVLSKKLQQQLQSPIKTHRRSPDDQPE